MTKYRLDSLRKAELKTRWRMVHGLKHALDKPPPVTPLPQALEEYGAAIESTHSWLHAADSQDDDAIRPQEWM